MSEQLILVFYINVEGLSRLQANEYIESIYTLHKENGFYNIFLPVNDQKTKVELLCTKELDPISKEKVDKMYEKINDLYCDEVERRKRKIRKL
jgi:hypothetical protein